MNKPGPTQPHISAPIRAVDLYKVAIIVSSDDFKIIERFDVFSKV